MALAQKTAEQRIATLANLEDIGSLTMERMNGLLKYAEVEADGFTVMMFLAGLNDGDRLALYERISGDNAIAADDVSAVRNAAARYNEAHPEARIQDDGFQIFLALGTRSLDRRAELVNRIGSLKQEDLATAIGAARTAVGPEHADKVDGFALMLTLGGMTARERTGFLTEITGDRKIDGVQIGKIEAVAGKLDIQTDRFQIFMALAQRSFDKRADIIKAAESIERSEIDFLIDRTKEALAPIDAFAALFLAAGMGDDRYEFYKNIAGEHVITSGNVDLIVATLKKAGVDADRFEAFMALAVREPSKRAKILASASNEQAASVSVAIAKLSNRAALADRGVSSAPALQIFVAILGEDQFFRANADGIVTADHAALHALGEAVRTMPADLRIRVADQGKRVASGLYAENVIADIQLLGSNNRKLNLTDAQRNVLGMIGVFERDNVIFKTKDAAAADLSSIAGFLIEGRDSTGVVQLGYQDMSGKILLLSGKDVTLEHRTKGDWQTLDSMKGLFARVISNDLPEGLTAQEAEGAGKIYALLQTKLGPQAAIEIRQTYNGGAEATVRTLQLPEALSGLALVGGSVDAAGVIQIHAEGELGGKNMFLKFRLAGDKVEYTVQPTADLAHEQSRMLGQSAEWLFNLHEKTQTGEKRGDLMIRSLQGVKGQEGVVRALRIAMSMDPEALRPGAVGHMGGWTSLGDSFRTAKGRDAVTYRDQADFLTYLWERNITVSAGEKLHDPNQREEIICVSGSALMSELFARMNPNERGMQAVYMKGLDTGHVLLMDGLGNLRETSVLSGYDTKTLRERYGSDRTLEIGVKVNVGGGEQLVYVPFEALWDANGKFLNNNRISLDGRTVTLRPDQITGFSARGVLELEMVKVYAYPEIERFADQGAALLAQDSTDASVKEHGRAVLQDALTKIKSVEPQLSALLADPANAQMEGLYEISASLLNREYESKLTLRGRIEGMLDTSITPVLRDGKLVYLAAAKADALFLQVPSLVLLGRDPKNLTQGLTIGTQSILRNAGKVLYDGRSVNASEVYSDFTITGPGLTDPEAAAVRQFLIQTGQRYSPFTARLTDKSGQWIGTATFDGNMAMEWVIPAVGSDTLHRILNNNGDVAIVTAAKQPLISSAGPVTVDGRQVHSTEVRGDFSVTATDAGVTRRDLDEAKGLFVAFGLREAPYQTRIMDKADGRVIGQATWLFEKGVFKAALVRMENHQNFLITADSAETPAVVSQGIFPHNGAAAQLWTTADGKRLFVEGPTQELSGLYAATNDFKTPFLGDQNGAFIRQAGSASMPKYFGFGDFFLHHDSARVMDMKAGGWFLLTGDNASELKLSGLTGAMLPVQGTYIPGTDKTPGVLRYSIFENLTADQVKELAPADRAPQAADKPEYIRIVQGNDPSMPENDVLWSSKRVDLPDGLGGAGDWQGRGLSFSGSTETGHSFQGRFKSLESATALAAFQAGALTANRETAFLTNDLIDSTTGLLLPGAADRVRGFAEITAKLTVDPSDVRSVYEFGRALAAKGHDFMIGGYVVHAGKSGSNSPLGTAEPAEIFHISTVAGQQVVSPNLVRADGQGLRTDAGFMTERLTALAGKLETELTKRYGSDILATLATDLKDSKWTDRELGVMSNLLWNYRNQGLDVTIGGFRGLYEKKDGAFLVDRLIFGGDSNRSAEVWAGRAVAAADPNDPSKQVLTGSQRLVSVLVRDPEVTTTGADLETMLKTFPTLDRASLSGELRLVTTHWSATGNASEEDRLLGMELSGTVLEQKTAQGWDRIGQDLSIGTAGILSVLQSNGDQVRHFSNGTPAKTIARSMSRDTTPVWTLAASTIGSLDQAQTFLNQQVADGTVSKAQAQATIEYLSRVRFDGQGGLADVNGEKIGVLELVVRSDASGSSNTGVRILDMAGRDVHKFFDALHQNQKDAAGGSYTDFLKERPTFKQLANLGSSFSWLKRMLSGTGSIEIGIDEAGGVSGVLLDQFTAEADLFLSFHLTTQGLERTSLGERNAAISQFAESRGVKENGRMILSQVALSTEPESGRWIATSGEAVSADGLKRAGLTEIGAYGIARAKGFGGVLKHQTDEVGRALDQVDGWTDRGFSTATDEKLFIQKVVQPYLRGDGIFADSKARILTSAVLLDLLQSYGNVGTFELDDQEKITLFNRLAGTLALGDLLSSGGKAPAQMPNLVSDGSGLAISYGALDPGQTLYTQDVFAQVWIEAHTEYYNDDDGRPADPDDPNAKTYHREGHFVTQKTGQIRVTMGDLASSLESALGNQAQWLAGKEHRTNEAMNRLTVSFARNENRKGELAKTALKLDETRYADKGKVMQALKDGEREVGRIEFFLNSHDAFAASGDRQSAQLMLQFAQESIAGVAQMKQIGTVLADAQTRAEGISVGLFGFEFTGQREQQTSKQDALKQVDAALDAFLVALQHDDWGSTGFRADVANFDKGNYLFKVDRSLDLALKIEAKYFWDTFIAEQIVVTALTWGAASAFRALGQAGMLVHEARISAGVARATGVTVKLADGSFDVLTLSQRMVALSRAKRAGSMAVWLSQRPSFVKFGEFVRASFRGLRSSSYLQTTRFLIKTSRILSRSVRSAGSLVEGGFLPFAARFYAGSAGMGIGMVVFGQAEHWFAGKRGFMGSDSAKSTFVHGFKFGQNYALGMSFFRVLGGTAGLSKWVTKSHGLSHDLFAASGRWIAAKKMASSVLDVYKNWTARMLTGRGSVLAGNIARGATAHMGGFALGAGKFMFSSIEGGVMFMARNKAIELGLRAAGMSKDAAVDTAHYLAIFTPGKFQTRTSPAVTRDHRARVNQDAGSRWSNVESGLRQIDNQFKQITLDTTKGDGARLDALALELGRQTYAKNDSTVPEISKATEVQKQTWRELGRQQGDYLAEVSKVKNQLAVRLETTAEGKRLTPAEKNAVEVEMGRKSNGGLVGRVGFYSRPEFVDNTDIEQDFAKRQFRPGDNEGIGLHVREVSDAVQRSVEAGRFEPGNLEGSKRAAAESIYLSIEAAREVVREGETFLKPTEDQIQLTVAAVLFGMGNNALTDFAANGMLAGGLRTGGGKTLAVLLIQQSNLRYLKAQGALDANVRLLVLTDKNGNFTSWFEKPDEYMVALNELANAEGLSLVQVTEAGLARSGIGKGGIYFMSAPTLMQIFSNAETKDFLNRFSIVTIDEGGMVFQTSRLVMSEGGDAYARLESEDRVRADYDSAVLRTADGRLKRLIDSEVGSDKDYSFDYSLGGGWRFREAASARRDALVEGVLQEHGLTNAGETTARYRTFVRSYVDAAVGIIFAKKGLHWNAVEKDGRVEVELYSTVGETMPNVRLGDAFQAMAAVLLSPAASSRDIYNAGRTSSGKGVSIFDALQHIDANARLLRSGAKPNAETSIITAVSGTWNANMRTLRQLAAKVLQLDGMTSLRDLGLIRVFDSVGVRTRALWGRFEAAYQKTREKADAFARKEGNDLQLNVFGSITEELLAQAFRDTLDAYRADGWSIPEAGKPAANGVSIWTLRKGNETRQLRLYADAESFKKSLEAASDPAARAEFATSIHFVGKLVSGSNLFATNKDGFIKYGTKGETTPFNFVHFTTGDVASGDVLMQQATRARVKVGEEFRRVNGDIAHYFTVDDLGLNLTVDQTQTLRRAAGEAGTKGLEINLGETAIEARPDAPQSLVKASLTNADARVDMVQAMEVQSVRGTQAREALSAMMIAAGRSDAPEDLQTLNALIQQVMQIAPQEAIVQFGAALTTEMERLADLSYAQQTARIALFAQGWTQGLLTNVDDTQQRIQLVSAAALVIFESIRTSQFSAPVRVALLQAAVRGMVLGIAGAGNMTVDEASRITGAAMRTLVDAVMTTVTTADQRDAFLIAVAEGAAQGIAAWNFEGADRIRGTVLADVSLQALAGLAFSRTEDQEAAAVFVSAAVATLQNDLNFSDADFNRFASAFFGRLMQDGRFRDLEGNGVFFTTLTAELGSSARETLGTVTQDQEARVIARFDAAQQALLTSVDGKARAPIAGLLAGELKAAVMLLANKHGIQITSGADLFAAAAQLFDGLSQEGNLTSALAMMSAALTLIRFDAAGLTDQAGFAQFARRVESVRARELEQARQDLDLGNSEEAVRHLALAARFDVRARGEAVILVLEAVANREDAGQLIEGIEAELGNSDLPVLEVVRAYLERIKRASQNESDLAAETDSRIVRLASLLAPRLESAPAPASAADRTGTPASTVTLTQTNPTLQIFADTTETTAGADTDIAPRSTRTDTSLDDLQSAVETIFAGTGALAAPGSVTVTGSRATYQNIVRTAPGGTRALLKVLGEAGLDASIIDQAASLSEGPSDAANLRTFQNVASAVLSNGSIDVETAGRLFSMMDDKCGSCTVRWLEEATAGQSDMQRLQTYLGLAYLAYQAGHFAITDVEADESANMRQTVAPALRGRDGLNPLVLVARMMDGRVRAAAWRAHLADAAETVQTIDLADPAAVAALRTRDASAPFVLRVLVSGEAVEFDATFDPMTGRMTLNREADGVRTGVLINLAPQAMAVSQTPASGPAAVELDAAQLQSITQAADALVNGTELPEAAVVAAQILPGSVLLVFDRAKGTMTVSRDGLDENGERLMIATGHLTPVQIRTLFTELRTQLAPALTTATGEIRMDVMMLTGILSRASVSIGAAIQAVHHRSEGSLIRYTAEAAEGGEVILNLAQIDLTDSPHQVQQVRLRLKADLSEDDRDEAAFLAEHVLSRVAAQPLSQLLSAGNDFISTIQSLGGGALEAMTLVTQEGIVLTVQRNGAAASGVTLAATGFIGVDGQVYEFTTPQALPMNSSAAAAAIDPILKTLTSYRAEGSRLAAEGPAVRFIRTAQLFAAGGWEIRTRFDGVEFQSLTVAGQLTAVQIRQTGRADGERNIVLNVEAFTALSRLSTLKARQTVDGEEITTGYDSRDIESIVALLVELHGTALTASAVALTGKEVAEAAADIDVKAFEQSVSVDAAASRFAETRLVHRLNLLREAVPARPILEPRTIVLDTVLARTEAGRLLAGRIRNIVNRINGLFADAGLLQVREMNFADLKPDTFPNWHNVQLVTTDRSRIPSEVRIIAANRTLVVAPTQIRSALAVALPALLASRQARTSAAALQSQTQGGVLRFGVDEGITAERGAEIDDLFMNSEDADIQF